jgi:hypothetical protein
MLYSDLISGMTEYFYIIIFPAHTLSQTHPAEYGSIHHPAGPEPRYIPSVRADISRTSLQTHQEMQCDRSHQQPAFCDLDPSGERRTDAALAEVGSHGNRPRNLLWLFAKIAFTASLAAPPL